jgi:hypothetical protein
VWDDFPLFRNEEEIATLVIGKDRAKEWPRIAKLLEDEDHSHRLIGTSVRVTGRPYPHIFTIAGMSISTTAIAVCK